MAAEQVGVKLASNGEEQEA